MLQSLRTSIFGKGYHLVNGTNGTDNNILEQQQQSGITTRRKWFGYSGIILTILVVLFLFLSTNNKSYNDNNNPRSPDNIDNNDDDYANSPSIDEPTDKKVSKSEETTENDENQKMPESSSQDAFVSPPQSKSEDVENNNDDTPDNKGVENDAGQPETESQATSPSVYDNIGQTEDAVDEIPEKKQQESPSVPKTTNIGKSNWFMRYRGLGLDDPVPDRDTIWNYKIAPNLSTTAVEQKHPQFAFIKGLKVGGKLTSWITLLLGTNIRIDF
jgi:hypothetical protein